MKMNEYCRGALEALSWARSLLETRSVNQVRGMLDQAKEDILNGCAIDFAERLRAVARP